METGNYNNKKQRRESERKGSLHHQPGSIDQLMDVMPSTHIQQRTAQSGLSGRMCLTLERLEAQGSGKAWPGWRATSWRWGWGRRNGMRTCGRADQKGSNELDCINIKQQQKRNYSLPWQKRHGSQGAITAMETCSIIWCIMVDQETERVRARKQAQL